MRKEVYRSINLDIASEELKIHQEIIHTNKW
jgi:hypothetical protein